MASRQQVIGGEGLDAELERIVRGTPWLVDVLDAVRSVDLADAYVAAGAIRNTVWDFLDHGICSRPIGDVDVVYFDPADPEDDHETMLRVHLPQHRWEVTNQATVHRWQSAALGRPVSPYGSVAEGLASWPETATAVGVRLTPRGGLEVVAPFGLEDLFSMTVRPSPALVDSSAYRSRAEDKGWLLRWPGLTILALVDDTDSPP